MSQKCTTPIAAFLLQLKKIGERRHTRLAPSTKRWFSTGSPQFERTRYLGRTRDKSRSERMAKDVRTEAVKVLSDSWRRRRNPAQKGIGQGVRPPCSGREQPETSSIAPVTDHAQGSGKRSNSPVAALCNPLQDAPPECKKKMDAQVMSPGKTKAAGIKSLLSSDSPSTENLDSLAARLDYLIKKSDNNVSEESLTRDIKRIAVLDNHEARAAHSKLTWTITVNCMKASREMKERLIRERPLPRSRLNYLDRVEEKACAELFGAFCYLMEGSTGPCKPTSFDKDEVDRLMELSFGSLDDPERDLSVYNRQEHDHEAKILFSKYLARKVWCPTPWTKIEDAEKSFYKRMSNRIEDPVNMQALDIAKRILMILIHDRECIYDGYETSRCKDHQHEIKLADPSEFRRKQYVPDGACLERGRSEGGKRFGTLFGADPLKDQCVKACPILTGGKIRTITIDSMHNQEFIWINKFLGSRFRRLKCSVFGGKVEEWWNQIGGLKVGEGEYLISGDLESATDNFDGRITEELIDIFCREFYEEEIWQEKSKRIKSFTTSARFKKRDGTYCDQERGQLMGSVVSFPFLCILSLTAYMFALKEQNYKLYTRIMGDDFEKAWTSLHGLKSVGINGDDVAFSGNQEAYLGWMRGVTAIGGIVSKGKSLRNRRYFTINSELWSVDGKINCLRPSLVTALTGDNRYFINPAVEWKEFRLCGLAGIKRDTLYSCRAENIWDLTSKLNLHLPRNMGGLGIVNAMRKKNNIPREKLEDDLIQAWIRTEAEKRTSSIMAGFDEALDHIEELRTLKANAGNLVSTWVHDRDKKALSLRFRTHLGAWRLSKNEALLILNMCRFPDQFKVSDDILKRCRRLLPAIEKMRIVTPGEVESELDQYVDLDCTETKREALGKYLLCSYEYMLDGYRKVCIPEQWLSAYESFNIDSFFDD